MTDSPGSGKGQSKESPAAPPPIPDHPLAAKIQPDLYKHQSSVILIGYQKVAPDRDQIRIYLLPDLRSYFELPRSDILHHWASDPHDENSPTIFSIKATATPNLVIAAIPSAVAGFLDGEIVASLLANAILSSSGSSSGPGSGPPPPPVCVVKTLGEGTNLLQP